MYDHYYLSADEKVICFVHSFAASTAAEIVEGIDVGRLSASASV